MKFKELSSMKYFKKIDLYVTVIILLSFKQDKYFRFCLPPKEHFHLI